MSQQFQSGTEGLVDSWRTAVISPQWKAKKLCSDVRRWQWQPRWSTCLGKGESRQATLFPCDLLMSGLTVGRYRSLKAFCLTRDTFPHMSRSMCTSCGYTHMCACVHRGQKAMLGVFLNVHLIFLRKYLLLSLEPTTLAGLAGQQVAGVCVHLPGSGMPGACCHVWLFHLGVRDLKKGPSACKASTY